MQGPVGRTTELELEGKAGRCRRLLVVLFYPCFEAFETPEFGWLASIGGEFNSTDGKDTLGDGGQLWARWAEHGHWHEGYRGGFREGEE